MNPEIVVITGASAGIGRATARAFGKRGAFVGLLARGRDGLEAAKREIEELGGRALVCVVDVANPDQVERAAEQVERELGPIDIWINNAMVSVFSPVTEMQVEDFRRVTDVTYLGYVWGTMAALRRMKPRNRGVILQVGSALAYRGIPLQSAYCAAKHAVQGFNDSLRAELHHDRSRVVVASVQVPAVNTPQFNWVRSRLPNKAQPVPPIYQPEVVAEAIVFAATHKRRETYLGLPTIKAIVADKIAPGLMDRYLGRNAYESQQTDEPADPQRPDNLMQPVPGDHGARGRFDHRAYSSSPQLWLNKNRWRITTLASMACAAGWLLAATRRSPATKPSSPDVT
jgi:NADP-dependent 3-hydroxy acid dehydrogenase YdfG